MKTSPDGMIDLAELQKDVGDSYRITKDDSAELIKDSETVALMLVEVYDLITQLLTQ